MFKYNQLRGTVTLPKLQVGMVDPHINEVVTHVAELDEDAFRRQSRKSILPCLILAIIFPWCWIWACIACCSNEYKIRRAIEETQVYLTEHTLVYTMGNLPMECNRVTIPLTNIASVMVQPDVVTVNIKPTAPEVMINRQSTAGGNCKHNRTIVTAVATRSMPICHIQNAEEFAKAIQSNLH